VRLGYSSEGMHGSRLPRIYLLFVLLEGVQLALFVTVMGTHVPRGGIALMLVLLAGLAYGSALAWGLLLVMNAIPLLAIAGVSFSSGQGTLWGNVAVLVLTSLALVATLLSPAMRRHIGHRHHRPSSSSA
jgi:hypothetical protein